MGKISDSLTAADQGALTRRPPRSVRARAKFLVKKLGSTKAAAQLLGVDPSTVRRYIRGERTTPPAEIAERLEREVRRRWQPLNRKRARDRAATTGGITVETRAAFGYTAPVGTSDEARIRRITKTLPPRYAARLFQAHSEGAPEQQLEDIIAEGLQEVYFQDEGRRARGLLTVRFGEIDYIDVAF